MWTLPVKPWGESLSDGDRINRIFGDTKGTGAGSVIFLDALPLESVKLEADVMTPHYSPYYQGEDDAPADWHNPVPIPFSTVAANTAFLFGVLPRRMGDGKATEDCQLIQVWLEHALNTIGAGAKTAVGYGWFRRDDRRLDQLLEAMAYQAEADRKASLSPEGQVIENLRKLFQAHRARSERSAGSEAAQELAKVLGVADTWERVYRIQVAELAEEIIVFLQYGKIKLKERKQQIRKLRDQ